MYVRTYIRTYVLVELLQTSSDHVLREQRVQEHDLQSDHLSPVEGESVQQRYPGAQRRNEVAVDVLEDLQQAYIVQINHSKGCIILYVRTYICTLVYVHTYLCMHVCEGYTQYVRTYIRI